MWNNQLVKLGPVTMNGHVGGDMNSKSKSGTRHQDRRWNVQMQVTTSMIPAWILSYCKTYKCSTLLILSKVLNILLVVSSTWSKSVRRLSTFMDVKIQRCSENYSSSSVYQNMETSTRCCTGDGGLWVLDEENPLPDLCYRSTSSLMLEKYWRSWWVYFSVKLNENWE